MSLLRLQQQFKDTLLQSRSAFSEEKGNLSSSLAVYQNNLYESLYKTLSDKFKMTKAWLGEEEFFVLAKQYIFTVPQRSPYLCEYGEGFSLSIDHGAVRDLSELEWKMSLSVLSYQSQSPLCFEEIIKMDPRLMSGCVFRLHSSVHLYTSSYALKETWMAIKNSRPVPAYKQVSCFFISTQNRQSSFFTISENEYHFLRMIKEGKTLGDAYDFLEDAHFFQMTLNKFMPYFIGVSTSPF